MDDVHVTRAFARMGVRARIHPFQRWADAMSGPVRIDVLEDHLGEYFDVAFDDDRDLRLQVLDVQEKDRHLVLRAEDSTFLCGHDERHWFVAAIPETARATNVRAAKEALMPEAVHDALERKRVKRRHRHRRRNEAFLRQGEWR